MARSVLLARAAGKVLARVDTVLRARLLRKIAALAEDPTKEGEPLRGSADQWRARVGGWRLLYRFDPSTLWVDAIGSRGQVYRDVT